MINTQFDFKSESLPTTTDPLEFGDAAAEMMDRFNNPQTTELLADPNGGIIYSAPGASDEDRASAALAFAFDRLGGESANVTDRGSWDYMYLEDNLKPLVADPAITAQMQALFVQTDAISEQMVEIRREANGEFTAEQQQQMEELQERNSALYEQIDVLGDQQEEIVDRRITEIANSDGNPELSAAELAGYIYTVDQDGDGVIANTEERFDIVPENTPPSNSPVIEA